MRFNKKAQEPKTVNLAGGEAYPESAKLELVSILLTSFASNQFYRKAGDAAAPEKDTTLGRLSELLGQVNPIFAAKAAVYARQRFGMRSITHVVAGEIASRVKGADWTADFYRAVIRRPDDMIETVAYYLGKFGKPLPNALKRGLATAFGKFDEYALAKYRGEGKALSLVDLANLVHPKPTDRNREALAKLMKGDLRSTETWESKLTAAGTEHKGDKDAVAEAKAEAWKELLAEGKLGYFAALRNLRNIMEQAPDQLAFVLELLVDGDRIKKSLVLPFRFMTALGEIEKVPGGGEVLASLSRAVDLSCNNVPAFEGRTLVALDCSASMGGRPAQIGSLFAAVLAKRCGADLICFSTGAEYRSVNRADSTLTIARSLTNAAGGTNFHAIFQLAAERAVKYDRIVILSDMQGWIGYDTPAKDFEAYKAATGASPHVYSWDLAGHGTLQFPERQVYCLAGFSEKVFDLMAMLEQDREAMLHEIEAVSLEGGGA